LYYYYNYCIIKADIIYSALIIQGNPPTKTFKDILQQTVNSAKYASVDGLRKKLQLRKKKNPSTTLYATLHRFVGAKTIFDAGKGWYSTIQTPFTPHYESIREVVRQLEKQFPQLYYSVWSTEQLQPFAHHLMNRCTTFVYTETDAIRSVTEFLQSQQYTVYSNPKQADVEKYVAASNRKIIVRALVTEEPVDGHYATIEKVLVDLFLEKDRLFLMDGAEYKRIFEGLIFSNRINIGRLLRYAARREIKSSVMKLLSEHKSTTIM
jgi:hypothetical protein